MVISCEEVWREISNYLDEEINPDMKAAIDEHLRACNRCTAVLNGARNVVRLYGDERMMELPAGFSDRLQQNLNAGLTGGRRSFLVWMATAAAAAVIAGIYEAGRVFSPGRPELRSEHAQPGRDVPPHMEVVVSTDGKAFHVRGCPFIHGKATVRTVEAQEAMKEGYTPCVRCMKEYLLA